MLTIIIYKQVTKARGIFQLDNEFDMCEDDRGNSHAADELEAVRRDACYARIYGIPFFQ
jgi:hypothetical protein